MCKQVFLQKEQNKVFHGIWRVGVASIVTIYFKNSSGNLSVLFLTKTHADRQKESQTER